jgi:hypothetical protein
MKLTEIESSNIAAIGYDAASKRLRVQFKNGGLYEYPDVPAKAHDEFMGAESKGSHFAKHIRGKFEGKKV